jgi:hypothetical protein
VAREMRRLCGFFVSISQGTGFLPARSQEYPYGAKFYQQGLSPVVEKLQFLTVLYPPPTPQRNVNMLPFSPKIKPEKQQVLGFQHIDFSMQDVFFYCLKIRNSVKYRKMH